MIRTALRLAARVLAMILCVLSLGVCGLAAYQWARGYEVVDVWELDDQRTRAGEFTHTVYRLSSGRGALALNYARRSSLYSPHVVYMRSSRRGGFTTAPSQFPADSHFRRHRHATLRPDQFNLLRRTVWQKIGFNADYESREDAPYRGIAAARYRLGQLRLPYWAIVTTTGILPLLYLRRLKWVRRRYRARHGLCPGCGYDVRASRERCPECGEGLGSHVSAAPPAAGAPATASKGVTT